ncbi:MAG TPA: hypothetical protein VGM56_07055 [Byssovorax sp.]|jgi:hypothetical protein
MRSPRALRPTLAVAIALAALAPRLASAAPNDAEGKLVKDMVKDATAAEKAGKCKESLAILRQAAAVRETGEVLLHVGACQARTGALLEALKTWTNAQQAATTEKDKATIAALGPRIDELRTRIPTISLRLPKDATNLQVKVDDTPEPSDKPILVNPGDHTVSATANGRAPFSTKITLGEKDTKVVEVDLGAPVMRDSGLDAPKAAPASAGPSIPLGTWIGGGAAVVLLVGGILSFAAAGGAATDGAAACATAVTCDSSQKSKVQTLDALALTMWIGAGASAGFATTWYFTMGRKRPKPDLAALGQVMKRQKSEPAAPAAPAAAVTVGPGSVWFRASF